MEGNFVRRKHCCSQQSPRILETPSKSVRSKAQKHRKSTKAQFWDAQKHRSGSMSAIVGSGVRIASQRPPPLSNSESRPARLTLQSAGRWPVTATPGSEEVVSSTPALRFPRGLGSEPEGMRGTKRRPLLRRRLAADCGADSRSASLHAYRHRSTCVSSLRMLF